MMYSPGGYCGRAGCDVIGCRWPTSCVFACMLQTRVTLTVFPIVTPRGRSSSSHEGGHLLFLQLCWMPLEVKKWHIAAIRIFALYKQNRYHFKRCLCPNAPVSSGIMQCYRAVYLSHTHTHTHTHTYVPVAPHIHSQVRVPFCLHSKWISSSMNYTWVSISLYLWLLLERERASRWDRQTQMLS